MCTLDLLQDRSFLFSYQTFSKAFQHAKTDVTKNIEQKYYKLSIKTFQYVLKYKNEAVMRRLYKFLQCKMIVLNKNRKKRAFVASNAFGK